MTLNSDVAQKDRDTLIKEYEKELRKHFKWRARVHHDTKNKFEPGEYRGIESWNKMHKRRLAQDKKKFADRRRSLGLRKGEDEVIQNRVIRELGLR
ncbi:MAG: hypothetical protein WDZ82_00030 [Candidatus Paceibacterota bacterium]